MGGGYCRRRVRSSLTVVKLGCMRHRKYRSDLDRISLDLGIDSIVLPHGSSQTRAVDRTRDRVDGGVLCALNRTLRGSDMINALSQDLGAGGSSAPGPGAPGPSARRPGASESGVQGLRLTLRASVGTCAALGLARERCDVLPTTAYLLLGDRCRRTCAFCAQSSLSTAAAGMLSRVNWPEIDLDRLVSQLIRLSSASVSRTASASVSASATGPARVDAADCDRFALKDLHPGDGL